LKSHTVLLVDDLLLFRKGLAAALNNIQPHWDFIEASNGVEALEHVHSRRVDIALVDVRMPLMGGMELTQKLKLLYPDLPIIILTQFDEQSLILHFLRMGVNGFLCKNSDPEEVVTAIEVIIERGCYMNDIMIRASESGRLRLDLSARDKEIIYLLRQGKNSKQIASLLNLSEASIESYRKDLLHKTGTRNSAELVSLAHRTGIL
jgi:DNA-binding NarL/FixJ family response regulator